MMKITGLSYLFKWENLHNWWLTKYFFAPLYIYIARTSIISLSKQKKCTSQWRFNCQGVRKGLFY